MDEVTKVHEKMPTSFMFGPSLKGGGYFISLKGGGYFIIFEKSID
jgi:hypothetical protein